MKKILIMAIVATATLFSSCREDNKEMDNIGNSNACKEFLAAASGASIYYGSGKIAAYDIETEQISYTEDYTIYMVSDMEYTKSYTLDIDCDGVFISQSTLMVYYTSVGYEGILEEQGELSMTVAYVDPTAENVWLWNEKSGIGFVLTFQPLE